ncbi:MAG: AI-2E family transporter [Acidimicrobiales bacterium]
MTGDALTSTRIPPWVKRSILLWWGILVGLWASLATVRALRGLLTQIVLALFISFAMEPLVDRLNRRGISRGLASLGTMVLVFGLMGVFVTAMGSLIAEQLRELANDLPDYVNSADSFLEDRFGLVIDNAAVIQEMRAGGDVSRYLTGAADNLVSVGTSVVGILFQLLTISLFTYYFSADGPRMRRAVCSLMPPARQVEVLRVWELAITKTGAFISSRVILAIFSASFHWFVFGALGLPSALALGIWVGVVSQFIPVIGTYIAGTVPILITLGVDPIKVLWVLGAVVLYQQIENYVIQPRVTAHTLDMHPAVAFAAVLAGTAMFGVTGALLALPFLATVQAFISAYVERHDVIASPLVATDTSPLPLTTLGSPTTDPPDSGQAPPSPTDDSGQNGTTKPLTADRQDDDDRV